MHEHSISGVLQGADVPNVPLGATAGTTNTPDSSTSGTPRRGLRPGLLAVAGAGFVFWPTASATPAFSGTTGALKPDAVQTVGPY
jgi:hypothetical protein